MEHRDTLLTIAEIAVALAGFASIVTVIARRADDRSRTADAAVSDGSRDEMKDSKRSTVIAPSKAKQIGSA